MLKPDSSAYNSHPAYNPHNYATCQPVDGPDVYPRFSYMTIDCVNFKGAWDPEGRVWFAGDYYLNAFLAARYPNSTVAVIQQWASDRPLEVRGFSVNGVWRPLHRVFDPLDPRTSVGSAAFGSRDLEPLVRQVLAHFTEAAPEPETPTETEPAPHDQPTVKPQRLIDLGACGWEERLDDLSLWLTGRHDYADTLDFLKDIEVPAGVWLRLPSTDEDDVAEFDKYLAEGPDAGFLRGLREGDGSAEDIFTALLLKYPLPPGWDRNCLRKKWEEWKKQQDQETANPTPTNQIDIETVQLRINPFSTRHDRLHQRVFESTPSTHTSWFRNQWTNTPFGGGVCSITTNGSRAEFDLWKVIADKGPVRLRVEGQELSCTITRVVQAREAGSPVFLLLDDDTQMMVRARRVMFLGFVTSE